MSRYYRNDLQGRCAAPHFAPALERARHGDSHPERTPGRHPAALIRGIVAPSQAQQDMPRVRLT